MWYVVRTETGKEEVTAEAVRSCVEHSAYERCFCPKRQFLKKIRGRWALQSKVLFPGYFFIVTEQPQRLFFELKKVPGATRILGVDVDHFVPLAANEAAFYEELFGKTGGNTVKISEIVVEQDGSIRCLQGVLKGLENEIVKVNLRKRYAVVRTFLLGNERTMLLGIQLLKDEV